MFLQLFHPITNKYVDIFTPEVMELIQQGYTIHDVLDLGKKIPMVYNRNNIFTNDLLINYIIHLDIIDITSLCMIDKDAYTLHKNKNVWKLKIEHYLSKYPQFNNCTYKGKNTLEEYNKIVYATNKSQYDGKDIMFHFNQENLEVLRDLIPRQDYNHTLYSKQTIQILDNFIYIRCYLKNDRTLHTYAFNNEIFSDNFIKRFIYHIYYLFPNVHTTYTAPHNIT